MIVRNNPNCFRLSTSGKQPETFITADRFPDDDLETMTMIGSEAVCDIKFFTGQKNQYFMSFHP
jgi:hypothetical protein